MFSFQTLGVMQDAAENIATGAEVVDLMVAMVASSIKSHRRHLIFDPYPMVVDPRNPKEFAFTPKVGFYFSCLYNSSVASHCCNCYVFAITSCLE